MTGRVDEFAPAATVAHYDIDPSELGKIRHAELRALGDLREAVARTRAELDAPARSEAWLGQVRGWRERFPLRYGSAAPALAGPQAIEHLAAATADHENVVWTTGVGQHQMWAMQCLPCERPRSFITSGGHGTMGFGLPAAIGARAARPGAVVDHDDNGALGMVRQWQEMFYDKRLSQVRTPPATDIATVARGFGARGFTVRDADGLLAAFAEALACGETCVIDAKVVDGETLYPMIQPGSAGVDVVEYPGR